MSEWHPLKSHHREDPVPLSLTTTSTTVDIGAFVTSLSPSVAVPGPVGGVHREKPKQNLNVAIPRILPRSGQFKGKSKPKEAKKHPKKVKPVSRAIHETQTSEMGWCDFPPITPPIMMPIQPVVEAERVEKTENVRVSREIEVETEEKRPPPLIISSVQPIEASDGNDEKEAEDHVFEIQNIRVSTSPTYHDHDTTTEDLQATFSAVLSPNTSSPPPQPYTPSHHKEYLHSTYTPPKNEPFTAVLEPIFSLAGSSENKGCVASPGRLPKSPPKPDDSGLGIEGTAVSVYHDDAVEVCEEEEEEECVVEEKTRAKLTVADMQIHASAIDRTFAVKKEEKQEIECHVDEIISRIREADEDPRVICVTGNSLNPSSEAPSTPPPQIEHDVTYDEHFSSLHTPSISSSRRDCFTLGPIVDTSPTPRHSIPTAPMSSGPRLSVSHHVEPPKKSRFKPRQAPNLFVGDIL